MGNVQFQFSATAFGRVSLSKCQNVAVKTFSEIFKKSNDTKLESQNWIMEITPVDEMSTVFTHSTPNYTDSYAKSIDD